MDTHTHIPTYGGGTHIRHDSFSLKIMNQLNSKVSRIIVCPELKTSFKSQFAPQHLMPIESDQINKVAQPPKNIIIIFNKSSALTGTPKTLILKCPCYKYSQ